MDKKLPICIVLAMLMSCFSCKQPQQSTEDADMDTQWVDSSQHLYQYGICIDSLEVKEYLMKNGDNTKFEVDTSFQLEILRSLLKDKEGGLIIKKIKPSYLVLIDILHLS